MDKKAESHVSAWLSNNNSGDGSNTSVALLVARRLARYGSEYQSGQDWQCPAHDDGKASLGLSVGADGRALLNCQAGCTAYDILRALDLAESDLFVPKPPYRPITDLYDYRSAKGELLYQVVRHEGKAFSQRQLQGMRAVWSLNGIEPVLYRLPELARATAVGKRIYVAEGEKDVETLREAGVAATCNPGGAGKWREEYSEILRGAAVYVVADLDRAGAKHSRAVAESLRAHGCAVGIVQPKSGKDATDHFAAGYAVNDFEEFTWEPPPDENPETPEEDSTGGNDDESAQNGEPKHHPRLVTGGAFLFNDSEHSEAIWGDGDEVLWADGEGCMFAGPQGVGKSTVAQQLMLHRIGLREGEFLGYTVRRAEGLALYLAMDRPKQIRRSLLRMVTEDQRDYLDQHVIIWTGPLPFDVTSDKNKLADFGEKLGASDIYADSYKDLHPSIAKPEKAAAVNDAVQELIARGMQWCGNHHQRKATGNNPKPKSLDDVYGGFQLTAGLGSVILLWGEPGDTDVELSHLKQPADVVGPFTIHHEHKAGRTTKTESDRERVLRMLRDAVPDGMIEPAIMVMLYGLPSTDTEKYSSKKRVQRLRKQMEEADEIIVITGKSGGIGGGVPNRWHLAPDPTP